MTPREVVLRAIEFRDPPRVPMALPGSPSPAAITPSAPGESEWGFVYHSLAMPEENYQTLREAFARLVPPPRSR